jgi:hypothetical protein
VRAALANITQLAGRGRSFKEVFTIKAYLASEVPGHEFDQTTSLATITGTITGTKIAVE